MGRNTPSTLSESMSKERASFNAARSSKFRAARPGVNSTGVDADYHMRSQRSYFAMVELAREFERNEPTLRQGMKRLADNVGLESVRPEPETDQDEINTIVQEDWEEWAGTPTLCDARKSQTFGQLTRLAFIRTGIDGDAFGLPLKSGAIQSLESHRIRTPDQSKIDRGVVGVETDGVCPRRLWLTRKSIAPTYAVRVSDVKPVNIFDGDGERMALQMVLPDRISQSRGVTLVSPVVDIMAMRDDAEFAELVRKQAASCVAFMENVDMSAPTELWNNDEPDPFQATGDNDVPVTGMKPGMVLRGKPGRTWEAFAPNLPGDSHIQHNKVLLAYIAVNLGLPPMVLMLDAGDGNFSSLRGVMNQAQLGFDNIRDAIITQWFVPVYRWRLRLLAEKDSRVAAYLAREGLNRLARVNWAHRGYKYLKPLEDHTVHRSETANGMRSLTSYYADRGGKFDRVAGEIVDERAAWIAKGAERAAQLKEQFGIDVTWRDLVPLPLAEGIQLSMADQTRGESLQGPTENA